MSCLVESSSLDCLSIRSVDQWDIALPNVTLPLYHLPQESNSKGLVAEICMNFSLPGDRFF